MGATKVERRRRENRGAEGDEGVEVGRGFHFHQYKPGEWLMGRQQILVLNGIISSWLYVISGVPQGSIGTLIVPYILMTLTEVLLIGYLNLQMTLNWLAQFTV